MGSRIRCKKLENQDLPPNNCLCSHGSIVPRYSAPFSVEKYFENRGLESAVSEFELVRKILYVAIPFLIFFTVIDILKLLIEQFVSEDVVAMFPENIVFYSTRGSLFLTALADT
jgi:hypothetical protein